MASKDTTSRLTIENVLQPGSTYRVDAAKYHAMRAPYLSVLPHEPPGLTVAQIAEKVRPLLPDDLYPGGAKAGWWMKAVQLDLEAKGLVRRSPGAPVRLYRVSGTQ